MENKIVQDCLESTFVSSVGEYVDRFEKEIAEYTGAKRAISVVNGTAALHVALLLAGVKINEEVLVPSLTFVATANAISYCGAVPHFVDSEDDTLGVDPVKLEEYLYQISEVSGESCINKNTGRKNICDNSCYIFVIPVKLKTFLPWQKFNLKVVEELQNH